MTRAVLAVMAGLLCALAGWRHAAALRTSAARLHRWTEVLTHLALILSEGASTLPEALDQAATGDQPPDELLRALAADLRRQPLTPLNELYAHRALSGPEGDALKRLMDRLGRGSLEMRCQAVSQTAEELSLLAVRARENADRDATMWRDLGFIGGACLTLMLL